MHTAIYPIEAAVGQVEPASLFVPGMLRDESGEGLSPASELRIQKAGEFFIRSRMSERGGIIVCAGYKNPADTSGSYHALRDDDDNLLGDFVGLPEAFSMKLWLLDMGIDEEHIRTDLHSIDTVTNFTKGAPLLPEGLVGIAAQPRQLRRILRVIAPRTLTQPYIGLEVPTAPGMPEPLGREVVAYGFSMMAIRGLRPGQPNADEIATQRVEKYWGMRQKFSSGPKQHPQAA